MTTSQTPGHSRRLRQTCLRTTVITAAAIPLTMLAAAPAAADTGRAYYLPGQNSVTVSIRGAQANEACSLYVDGVREGYTAVTNEYGDANITSSYISAGSHTAEVQCTYESFRAATFTVKGGGQQSPDVLSLSGVPNADLRWTNLPGVLVSILSTLMR